MNLAGSETLVAGNAGGAGPAAPGGKFLTFFFNQEEYGIEILKVHEIIGMLPVTRVPGAPACMNGVVNLRGKVIPVIDLRAKFHLPPAAVSGKTCIIVVHVGGHVSGIMVDQVSEVVHIGNDEIEPAPAFGAGVRTEFILGIGKAQGKIRILLDIDRILSPEDEMGRQEGLEAAVHS